ncbi:phosphoadenosine phosphosulfate reductase (plasmid) [Xylanimonas cellulosilytica DSM 15894]|uniref:Phosphoadenosine phosphosulfate reductase n=1 Tax=Xylanimonas cellulosilytica (strain DSM 15894 / JCM 12276 / CECT 5975 / KCTC 9989 / LMG 20990 / NBRC 107835 / XIL07) TaxID=446471 RepID=D1C0S6_XYLCX|nr:phosphoadenosine phosphosulfate reductase family protein [Xylanimonas cellulosilytica]ACZ32392.1 phosphoadenosine phosphosulfate reductase [Xylanimonas cellulosilytica DSM 15894]
MNPGLDLRALQGLRATGRDLDALRTRIRAHLDQHEGYVAFSGGKDSLVALHLTLQVAPDVPVAFFDSGLEFPETYAYLEQLADQWHLNLDVIPARLTALQAMAANGSWDHAAPDRPTPDMHQVLITEPAAKAHSKHGPGEVWGVRAEESRGRAAAYVNALRAQQCQHTPTCTGPTARTHHGGRIARLDGTVALGPVWDWKTAEIWGHIARHHLPINPVYTRLEQLGAPERFLRVSAMLDGNMLAEGRVTWLRRGWPALFEELATVLPRIREFV